MDRYLLVVVVNVEPKKEGSCGGFETSRRLYNKLAEISSSSCSSGFPPFPACSLSGSPGLQKCYFAIQVSHSSAQFCSAEWEEVCVQCGDSEETAPSAVDSCIGALQDQDEFETTTHTELFEEAAEALHQLADKLPPPGRFLLDVVVQCEDEAGLKEFLPVIGSLKHMQAWHSAHVSVVTEHSAGWRKAASYLSARLCSPAEVLDCIDERELWRGGLLIRERKFVSELLFEGFSLKVQSRSNWSRVLSPDCPTERKLHSEVFHYYQPVLDLIQLVNVTNFPLLFQSSTEFELALSSRSARAKLLLEQLRTLHGEVGALFALSCVISTEVFPPAAQLSATRWRDFMAKRPKVLSVPEVEVKGEKGHYLLLVQGAESGGCRARLMHSASQINGAVAQATINSLIQEPVPSSSGSSLTAAWLRSLPRLHGDQLLRRERGLDRVQARVLQECLRRREEVQKPAVLPLNDLKVLLNLAREQYLNMQNTSLPSASERQPAQNTHTPLTESMRNTSRSEWPERSVLRNHENMQKIRHRSRSSLFSSGSSDSLMGPKDGPRSGSAQLDVRELLRHFTPDGLPTGELQPLPVLRGENAFQLSSELTARKVTKLPFTQASSSHYHGLEYCLDERRALERDRGFVRLQSRLIRFETQTTCCREPCPLPLALSPAPTPSPAPPSEPDGECLQSDPPQHKRRSREPDTHSHQYKRLCKSESSESVCSQGSVSSVTHPVVRALRPQAGRSLSTSSTDAHTPGHTHTKPGRAETESRSQKHNRMLKEVVLKTLKHHGISSEHECFETCSRRLFDVSKLYLKDLKTSRGLHEEMKKAAGRNAKQVIDWVMEKSCK